MSGVSLLSYRGGNSGIIFSRVLYDSEAGFPLGGRGHRNVVFSRRTVQERLIYLDGHSGVFNVFKYVFLLGMVYLCFITTISEGYTPFLYFQF